MPPGTASERFWMARHACPTRRPTRTRAPRRQRACAPGIRWRLLSIAPPAAFRKRSPRTLPPVLRTLPTSATSMRAVSSTFSGRYAVGPGRRSTARGDSAAPRARAIRPRGRAPTRPIRTGRGAAIRTATAVRARSAHPRRPADSSASASTATTRGPISRRGERTPDAPVVLVTAFAARRAIAGGRARRPSRPFVIWSRSWSDLRCWRSRSGDWNVGWPVCLKR
jgi:hypothetical protein